MYFSEINYNVIQFVTWYRAQSNHVVTAALRFFKPPTVPRYIANKISFNTVDISRYLAYIYLKPMHMFWQDLTIRKLIHVYYDVTHFISPLCYDISTVSILSMHLALNSVSNHSRSHVVFICLLILLNCLQCFVVPFCSFIASNNNK